MCKKIISFILTITCVFSFSLSIIAQDSNDSLTQSNYSESVCIDNQIVTYHYFSNKNSDFIKFKDPDLGETLIEKNRNTGIITMNGEYVARINTEMPSINSSSPASRSIREWKPYNTVYSNIVSAVATKVAWAGIIATLLGLPVSSSIVVQIAQQAASDYLPTIYYRQEQFYINPITTSRPIIASDYYFYKNANYTGSMGIYDGTYKL